MHYAVSFEKQPYNALMTYRMKWTNRTNTIVFPF